MKKLKEILQEDHKYAFERSFGEKNPTLADTIKSHAKKRGIDEDVLNEISYDLPSSLIYLENAAGSLFDASKGLKRAGYLNTAKKIDSLQTDILKQLELLTK